MCFFLGDVDRKYCKFKFDFNIFLIFSVLNEDYVGSGWLRGYMVLVGNNKFLFVGIFLGRDGNVGLGLCVLWDL